eukprot:2973192-Rhodomonas_salina.4
MKVNKVHRDECVLGYSGRNSYPGTTSTTGTRVYYRPPVWESWAACTRSNVPTCPNTTTSNRRTH